MFVRVVGPNPQRTPVPVAGCRTPSVTRPWIAIALAIAVLLALTLAQPATASRTQTSIFDPAVSTTWDATVRDHAMTDIQALGARKVRILVWWNVVTYGMKGNVRPAFDATDPAAYPPGAWSTYDAAILAARARGLGVYLQVSGPAPLWATATHVDGVTEPRPDEFQAFATAVARRYGALVDTWSFWNEANQNAFLRPQRKNGQLYAPRLYRRLYDAGRRGLAAAGRPNARVLLGELAPRGGQAIPPLAFLRGVLCLDSAYRRLRGVTCAKLATAGWAQHTYIWSQGPFAIPANRDDLTVASLSRLSRALDLGARAGRIPGGLGIYLTEHGVSTRGASGVGLASQPEFLAISERMAWRNARVRSYAQFQLMSPSDPRAFVSALRAAPTFASPLGLAQPAYEGWRMPLAVIRSRNRVSLWGIVRPARAPTTLAVQICDRSCGALSTTWRRLAWRRTDARGHLDGRRDVPHRSRVAGRVARSGRCDPGRAADPRARLAVAARRRTPPGSR